MGIFGKSNGGGRRKTARSPSSLLLSTVSTAANDYRVGLVDLSTAGVQITAPDLPPEGEEVVFRAEKVECFGRVIWARDRQCGISFENPITPAEVGRLRRLANI